MAQSYRSRFLTIMRRNELEMNALFARMADELSAAVSRAADEDGNVPRQALFDLQQRGHELTRRLYLGRNSRGELAPFDTLPNGRVVPLSPYMRVLWASISAVARLPVEQNAAMMTRNLSPGVLARMRRATRDPIPGHSERVSEQAADLVRPNPLAAYDAPHLWVDPNGYTLSERIWNTEAATRRHLDLYLDTAIREGRGALRMGRELEQFLRLDRAVIRTTRPYGVSASFDAMRLARTEISRAHQEATRVSAAMNPFVKGMKWNLSLSHPRRDICDDLAAGGPAGDGVYSIEEYPERPHPQCICYPTQVTVDSAESDRILDELSADIRATRAAFVDLVGPVVVEQFTALLLGELVSVAGLVNVLGGV